MKSFKSFLILIALVLAESLSAQRITPFVIASAGGFFNGQNFSLSWTIGETATETIGADILLTQGFQQPYYSTETFVPSIASRNLQVKVYPVPAYNLLTIKVIGNNDIDLLLSLYDALGRRLIHAKLEAGTTEYEMDLTDIHPGIYFLKITTSSGETVKTYQVPKTLK